MKKRFFLFFCCLLLCAAITRAATAIALVIELNDGKPCFFFLPDKPVLSFKDGAMVVDCLDNTTRLQFDEFENFHFEERQYDSAVEELAATEENAISFIWIDRNTLKIFGASHADKIRIINLSGHEMPVNQDLNADQSLTISLSDMPVGVYVVIVGNKQSFKIYKK